VKFKFITLLLGAIALMGCIPQGYTTRPDPVTGINLYTSDGGKIPGTWVYIIDDSVTSALRQIKASSNTCSLFTYSVTAGDSLASSVSNAMEQIFENTLPRKSLPTNKTAAQEGLTGTVIIKLDEFYPKFTCSTGQVEGHCSANTDLSMTVTLIKYPDGKRRYVHASSQRSTDGGSGRMCAGASNVIAESVKKATKDVLERLGEKISLVSISR